MSRALILSLNPEIETRFDQALREVDWEVKCCRRFQELLSLIEAEPWELVVVATSAECDLAEEALATLAEEMQASRTEVIIVAENPSYDRSTRCLELGASEYLIWPVLFSEIRALGECIHRRVGANAGAPGDQHFKSLPIEKQASFSRSVIGISRPMIDLSKQLVKIGRAPDLSVFITGETGTGKEVVARQIHELSKRSGPFCAVNCAAMVESLLESELFGHEKGAFTGASATKKGLWEEAANGTLFLDEITEASPALQAKLLRVLQEGTIRRVGSNREIKVTARVIAASNRNIDLSIQEGDFREDLYFRFDQILSLPPLRQRVEDIPLLAEYFCRRTGKGSLITPEAMALLCSYHWPGNVRELESVVIKLVSFSGRRIFPEDVLAQIRVEAHRIERQPTPIILSALLRTFPDRWPTVQELRNQYILEAYLCLGGESRVARRLGIDYRSVAAVLKQEDAGFVQSDSIEHSD